MVLHEKDTELIAMAQQAIHKNYDDTNFNHTVASALRCKNGKVYVGVNISSIHGACAEVIAIGNAITNGERDFECMVAVRGKQGEEILPPCGNCRQLLFDYAPNCDVIVQQEDTLVKLSMKELLPFAYQMEKE